MVMAEALLYDKLDNRRVRCNVCLWRCRVNPGKAGVCGVRRNENGSLRLLNYARVSSLAADPIEKKPLFHFFPGSSVLSFGTIGCNFHCIHCQNWQISCVETPAEMGRQLQNISPQQAIELTKRYHCQGISWTYNEPAIWLEYTIDSARLAKQEGLYTVYVTNGYITPEGLDAIELAAAAGLECFSIGRLVRAHVGFVYCEFIRRTPPGRNPRASSSRAASSARAYRPRARPGPRRGGGRGRAGDLGHRAFC